MAARADRAQVTTERYVGRRLWWSSRVIGLVIGVGVGRQGVQIHTSQGIHSLDRLPFEVSRHLALGPQRIELSSGQGRSEAGMRRSTLCISTGVSSSAAAL
ncbi:MAG: hypothetical protein ACI8S6_005074 [Myxococcota bacterium]